MGTKGGREVGSDEPGASETPQSGGRVEGAEDRGGDKGQLSRFHLLTWGSGSLTELPQRRAYRSMYRIRRPGGRISIFEISLSSSLYPPGPLRDVPE